MTSMLVLSNMYPPHAYGGYEMSCRDVVDRWRARGHDVTVLTTDLQIPGVDHAGSDGTHVRRALRWYWDDHHITNPSPWRRLRMERHNHRTLRDAIERSQPDVISVWNMGAMSLGLLATAIDSGAPIVYVVCDDWLLYGPELDAWIRMWAKRPALSRVAEVVTRLPTRLPDLGASGTFCFVSETVRRRAAEHSPWTFPHATVVRSGIDTTDFPLRPPKARAWQGRLLYVGRIDERKGIDTAIRALRHLDGDTILRIVGAGDRAYEARLHSLADELGVADRIEWSSLPRNELQDAYDAADALLFPSTWTEPFGLVPLEAMACATPVVATGVGGSGEYLVDGDNCLLFAAGDDDALSTAVRRLATDDELRDRLVRGGAATAAELTVDRLADVLERRHVTACTP